MEKIEDNQNIEIEEKERWRWVPEYKGKYIISSFGKIKSVEREITDKNGIWLRTQKERIMTLSVDKDGYRYVILSNQGERKFTIHRLVWTAFKGVIPKGMQVDHIKEGDKDNNRLSNLQLLTCKENINKHWQTRKKSKYPGVSHYKQSNKWMSYIRVNGKKVYLGLYVNEVDAANAHQAALKRLENG